MIYGLNQRITKKSSIINAKCYNDILDINTLTGEIIIKGKTI